MGNDPYHTISKTLLKYGNTLKLWSARFKNVLSALILYSCTTSTPAGHSKWKARSVSVGFCSSALKVNTVTLPNTSCNFIAAGWPFQKPIKISFDTTIRLSFSALFQAIQAHRARPADAAHTHADYPHNCYALDQAESEQYS